MIIAFSGLGGSGKSTHIRRLSEHFGKNRQVKVIALREYFLWPKLAAAIRGKKNSNIAGDQQDGQNVAAHAQNHDVKNKRSVPASAYFFIRDLFYIFDAIRIRIFVIYPQLQKLRKQKDILVFDRAADDFAVELAETSSHAYLQNLFASIFPKATLHIYLKSSPETVLKRKHEDPLVVLKNREKLYAKMIAAKQPIIISTEGGIHAATEAILILADAAVKNFRLESWVLYRAFVLNDQKPLLLPALIIDPQKLFKSAIANRMANVFLQKMQSEADLHAKYWQEDWQKYDAYCSGIAAKREKTLAYLSEHSFEYSLVKNDDQAFELSGDIDIVCFDLETYNKMLSLFEKSGKVIVQTKEKADIFIDGLLPIDLHFGLSFGNFRYTSENSFKKLSQDEARFLTTIAHAVAELTLVTLGDILKTKSAFNQETITKIGNEASKSGWGAGYKKWIQAAMHPEKHGYGFPQKMNAFALVRSRFGLFFREPYRIGALIKDLWLLALALRARGMGKTPFHEHWTENIG